jgi:molecular chaperone GrpE
MTFDEPGPIEGTAGDVIEVVPDVGDAPVTADAEVAFIIPAPICDAIATDDSHVVAAVESPSPMLAAITGLAETLGKRLDSLQSAFDREIRAESTREKVVDRLHAELQEYKNDLLLNVLRPVFVDLIQLHDDIGKIVASQAEDTPSVDLMRGFQQGIEDILYRQGVEPFELEDDAFDPRRQRAFSTLPTEDPDLNKRVADRLRKGFRIGEKVIRPEIVSVYALRRGPS